MASKITLYHGSKSGLQGAIRPDMSDGSNDFGAGFYMGTDVNQPKTLICRAEDPVFYTLELDLARLKVHQFEADEEWAMFVAYNRGLLEKHRDSGFYRRFENLRREYDVVFGKIANDKLFNVLTLFFDGLIGLPALVKSLTALNIGDQYCAISRKACGKIRIVGEKRFCEAELRKFRERSENQRRRATVEADKICRKFRREGEFFDEIVERWRKHG